MGVACETSSTAACKPPDPLLQNFRLCRIPWWGNSVKIRKLSDVIYIPANFQSTEVGIASHKNREIDGKTGKSPYTIDKSPDITSKITLKKSGIGGSDAEIPVYSRENRDGCRLAPIMPA